jgi:hypothetical protein
MTDPDPPDVLPCEADPDYECVRIGSQANVADGPASPPPGGRDPGPPLCPDGYVPRRRRDRNYTAEGKVIRPAAPPHRRTDEPDS